MATPTQSEEVAKKRKHAPVDASGEPSHKRSKTEKKKKEHRDGRSKKKDKGKAREGAQQFKVFQATLAMSIPPVFAGNLKAGAEEMLDSMVMRYIPALQGVLLSHSHLQFLEPAANIKADCPFSNVQVVFETTVWSPQVGMKLAGKVNLCSPDHISLLVHRTFNVSIPRRHIPTDNWEFEYGPAENDPEFGTAAADEEVADAAIGDSAAIEGSGRWVHKATGSVLGGSTGDLEFTVIGLTIANQMLSLVGSIQFEPFSIEEEYRQTTMINLSQESYPSISNGDNDTVEAMLDDDVSQSDEEPFETMSKMANKAVAEDVARRTKEADDLKAEKKRKRKGDAQMKQDKGKKLKS